MINTRKRLFSTGITAMLALLFAPLQATAADGAASTATIHIEISDMEPRPGDTLIVRLFDAAGWLDAAQAIRQLEIPVEGRERMSLELAGVPYPASYAVQLIQDRNGNHQLDMHWLPFPGPDEPYGFSNNYQPFGKPSFERASFELKKERRSLTIRMRQ